MQAQSINEVISLLDGVIDSCRTSHSRNGFFAALYRRVTQHVADGIKAGRFQNAARMEALDVVFANRYLHAYEQYHQGLWVSHVWRRAFDVAERSQPLIIQHLLLGMNAHINLDLGVAAAEICTPTSITDLYTDFATINSLLAEMVDDVQSRLDALSPMMHIVDTIAGRFDETIGNFSMERARNAAWANATTLVQIDQGQPRWDAIHTIDSAAVAFSHVLYDPAMDLVLAPARIVESHNTVHCIDVLAA